MYDLKILCYSIINTYMQNVREQNTILRDDSRGQNKTKIKNNGIIFIHSFVSYKRVKIWRKPPEALAPVQAK